MLQPRQPGSSGSRLYSSLAAAKAAAGTKKRSPHAGAVMVNKKRAKSNSIQRAQLRRLVSIENHRRVPRLSAASVDEMIEEEPRRDIETPLLGKDEERRLACFPADGLVCFSTLCTVYLVSPGLNPTIDNHFDEYKFMTA
jgi:hypothetical protein